MVSKFLFSWDEVPGKDSGRLIEVLKQEYGISLGQYVRINKINNRNIIVSEKDEPYSFPYDRIKLRLNDEKTKVNLKMNDGRSVEFKAKNEKGKINVYYSITNRYNNISLLIGFFLFILTIYIVIFSPISLMNILKNPNIYEPTIINTPFGKARPAIGGGGFIAPFLVIFCCLIGPSLLYLGLGGDKYVFNREKDSFWNDFIWGLIIYAVGIFILYSYASH